VFLFYSLVRLLLLLVKIEVLVVLVGPARLVVVVLVGPARLVVDFVLVEVVILQVDAKGELLVNLQADVKEELLVILPFCVRFGYILVRSSF